MVCSFSIALDPANRFLGWFYVDLDGVLFLQSFFHAKVTLLWSCQLQKSILNFYSNSDVPPYKRIHWNPIIKFSEYSFFNSLELTPIALWSSLDNCARDRRRAHRSRVAINRWVSQTGGSASENAIWSCTWVTPRGWSSKSNPLGHYVKKVGTFTNEQELRL